MHILLSNDDGYFAPGLMALFEAVSTVATVTVVAPDAERSGASNSLTLDRPLTMRRAHNGFHYVNGTPTDCVHLAVTGILDRLPDMVISGINHGANMGDDTVYSGTVAAATEGYLLGIPSIAVSLAVQSELNYATAGQLALDLIARQQAHPLGKPYLLNLNVPDCGYSDIKGIQVTRLGKRHKAEPVIPATNPRGERVFWVGPAGSAQDAGEGTDFYAVKQGYASLTPLQMDLTSYAQLDDVRGWMDKGVV